MISLSVLLTSCAGYNKIMRDHLSNPDNYKSYRAILTDIYYYDYSNGRRKVSDYTDEDFANHSVIFEIGFDNYDDLSVYLDGRESNRELSDFVIQLEVTEENNKILADNEFYEDISLNEPLDITASKWTYMDTNFFYIAGIHYNDTEYLNFDEGLSNIIRMMNKNKSFL